MITITSKKEGFRRCGQAHSKAPTEWSADRFTTDETEALLAEPMLVVVVSDAKPKGKKADKE